jgi:hypothetical protein
MATSAAYSQQKMVVDNNFEKQIDTAKLEKILILNDPKAIIRVIQNDVDLYKINYTSKNDHTTDVQKLIRELPKSTINMKSILSGLEIESVIGLFLPFEQLQNTNSRDALFIREDAGIWTLIHEYMHFLFNEFHRKNHALDAPKLQNIIKDSTETYNEEFSKYRMNNKFQDNSRQNSYVEALLSLCRHNLQYILNFSIEEIVIEEQLQYKFQTDLKNNINFLETEENNYSDKYISKNLKSALNTTEYILRLIEEARKILPTDSYKKIKIDIESYESKYKNILFELKKRKPAEMKTPKSAEVFTA